MSNQCNIVGWAEHSEAQHPRWVALRLTQPTKRYFNSSRFLVDEAPKRYYEPGVTPQN